jgi:hypothetical protein
VFYFSWWICTDCQRKTWIIQFQWNIIKQLQKFSEQNKLIIIVSKFYHATQKTILAIKVVPYSGSVAKCFAQDWMLNSVIFITTGRCLTKGKYKLFNCKVIFMINFI